MNGGHSGTMTINTLTSLRFFFAMMVFGTHCYVISSFFDAHIFKEGFVGVSFFFVLSGFVIAYNYQHGLERGTVSRRSFWVARIARVYPMHWFTLLLAAVLGNYVMAAGGIDWLKHFVASLTLTNAYVPRADYFFSFNSPAWSLCCEQLFYLCFPLLIPLTKNSRQLAVAFALVAVVMPVGMYLTPEDKIKAYWYVNPITRFPDFIVGILLFHLYGHLKDRQITYTRASWAELLSVLLFLAFYLCASSVPKVYRYSCYYWLPVSVVLISFALQKGMLSRLLSKRIFIIGGEISYSFYLLHLFVLLSYAEWQKNAEIQIDWYYSVPALLVLSLLLSWCSYHYIEIPMKRKLKLLLNK